MFSARLWQSSTFPRVQRGELLLNSEQLRPLSPLPSNSVAPEDPMLDLMQINYLRRAYWWDDESLVDSRIGVPTTTADSRHFFYLMLSPNCISHERCTLPVPSGALLFLRTCVMVVVELASACLCYFFLFFAVSAGSPTGGEAQLCHHYDRHECPIRNQLEDFERAPSRC